MNKSEKTCENCLFHSMRNTPNGQKYCAIEGNHTWTDGESACNDWKPKSDLKKGYPSVETISGDKEERGHTLCGETALKHSPLRSAEKPKGEKIVLDLCGGTGAWSKPYRDAGYDVRLVTLPQNDVRTFVPPENVYGILAAPPCTMFSLARTTAKLPRNFWEGMECVRACMKIIWDCRCKNKLAFWALENPMGYLRQFLGRPHFTFDPCDFGDPYTKKTDLWGYFNEPRKRPVKLTAEQVALCAVNNRPLPSIRNITRQADKRAITPPGFAKAFFEANP